jgi:hypothetical protein
MHVTQIKQVGCSLAAGWWRPVSALPAVSRECRLDVKTQLRLPAGRLGLSFDRLSAAVNAARRHWPSAAHYAGRENRLGSYPRCARSRGE